MATEPGIDSLDRLFAAHQVSIVAARVAAALGAARGKTAEEEETPKSLVLDAVDYIDLTFRDEWGRAATGEEVSAVLRAVAMDIEIGTEPWPRNLWVDAISEAFEVGNDVVLAFPEEALDDLRDLWDDYIEALAYHGDDESKAAPGEGVPPLPDVALETFLDRADAALADVHEEAVWLSQSIRLAAQKKKLRIYDFDETLAVATGYISIVHSDGEKITIDSATFAYFRPVEGDKLDFGAFNDVHKPRKIKKNWNSFEEDSKDDDTEVVILTARPKGSASSVRKYLDSQGVKNVKVVALQSSDPYDKARWIDKAIEEGEYEDVRFTDDSTRNAAAVAEHGEKHKEKGLKFESIHSPHPHSDDEFLGAAADDSWHSDDPTTAVSEFKPSKPSDAGSSKSDAKDSKPSDWWSAQTPEFHKSYCREHESSKYCNASEGRVATKDPNAALKKSIEARLKKSKNRKVQEYAKSFVEKLDQAGPMAGMWVDQVEHDFDGLAKKPEGLLKGFTADDFDDLYSVLFGVDRPKKTKGNGKSAYRTAAWKPTGDGKHVGIFLPLPPGLAQQFPDLGAEDDSPPHVTLLYVGEVPKAKEELFTGILLSVLSKEPAPIRARLGEVDYFVHPHQNRQVFYSAVHFSRDLSVIRDRLRFALESAGFVVKHSFPLAFFPHVTLGYLEDAGAKRVWDGVTPTGSWDFSDVSVWGLSKPVDVALGTYVPEANGLTKMPVLTVVQRVASRHLKAVQADSDGSYMSVTALEALQEHARKLSEQLDNNTSLPDWVEAKITRANADLLDVYEFVEHGGLERERKQADKVPGGLADKRKPSDFDAKALAKGKKVEREHTDDPDMAQEIAMDHLTEDPAYYDKLEKIEKSARRRV